MNRILLLCFVVAAVGCNKPSGESCRKAIRNMRSLMGTDSPTNMKDIEGDVRRCKGGSTKKAVECAGKATSLDELRACDFMKVPTKKSTTPDTNAASGSSTGSAPAGSGSADAVGSGSAAGSGSAVGSGSAAGSGSAP